MSLLVNLAAGAICAVGSWAFPQWSEALKIGYVASLATKLSDTFASEIGKVKKREGGGEREEEGARGPGRRGGGRAPT